MQAIDGLRKKSSGMGSSHWQQNGSSVKEFHNSLKLIITKVYLFGDKLTEKVVIHSPLLALDPGNKPSRKRGGRL